MARKIEKPGYIKLLEDVQAVEDRFKEPTFKGEFNMATWGNTTDRGGLRGGLYGSRPKPNHCTTTACLAGWLAIESENGFKGRWHDGKQHALMEYDGFFSAQAVAVYGITPGEANSLFMTSTSEGGPAVLKRKLKQARNIAKKYGKRELMKQLCVETRRIMGHGEVI